MVEPNVEVRRAGAARVARFATPPDEYELPTRISSSEASDDFDLPERFSFTVISNSSLSARKSVSISVTLA